MGNLSKNECRRLKISSWKVAYIIERLITHWDAVYQKFKAFYSFFEQRASS